MRLTFCLTKRCNLLVRGLHAGKNFSNPNPEDILFRSISVNLKLKRWKLLKQMLPSITNTVLSRVICENPPQLALQFYDFVGKNKGVHLSLQSYCTLVHVLVNSRRFDEALSILGDLMLVNHLSALEILDSLFDSYESCGSNSAVFDSLVRACSQAGNSGSAYEVIKKLQVKGIWVTVHAWNNFLNHLVKLHEIGRFWRSYKEMLSYGYTENLNTLNLVIYALCKEAKLLEAMSVLYRIFKSGVVANVVTFNMIIDAFCMGDIQVALKLFRKMRMMSLGKVLPNSVTYNCLINGFAKARKMEAAEEVRDEMVNIGIEPNVRTCATLIYGYALAGNLEKALKLCDKMAEDRFTPNVVVYNTIIYWLYDEGDTDGASLVLSDMIDKKVCPDKFTYAILTKGLCSNGYVIKALNFLSKEVDKNVFEDGFLHNILINYMCRNKNLDVAKQLLANMFVIGLVPDLVTYGTLVDGFCKEGKIHSAIRVYEKMIKMGERPNMVIYNSLLNGLCIGDSADTAKLVADELHKIGLLDVVSYNSLIHGYCVSGQVNKAFALVAEMKRVGIVMNRVTYNILINCVCKFGCIQQAKELVEMMVLQGMLPDDITYTTLITNSNKNGLSDEVIDLHDYMVLKGVKLDMKTYNGIVSPFLQEEQTKTRLGFCIDNTTFSHGDDLYTDISNPDCKTLYLSESKSL